MADYNVGNIVGLLRSLSAPLKKYIVWAKQIDNLDLDKVTLMYYEKLFNEWNHFNAAKTFFLPPIIDFNQNTPPGSPILGDTYLLGAAPTGLWVGKAFNHVTWMGNTWEFITPRKGAMCKNTVSGSIIYFYDGSLWDSVDTVLDLGPGSDGQVVQYQSGVWTKTTNLLDSSNSQSIDIVNRKLMFNSFGASIDFGLGLMYDNTFALSIDYATQRKLYKASGAATLDWENGKLLTTAGFSAVDWTNFTLGTPGFTFVNWGNNELKNQISGVPHKSINWTLKELYDDTDTLTLKYSTKNLYGDWTANAKFFLSADPLSALEAATKSYVDNLVTGLSWKTAVVAATTANITLSGAQTIDGISVIAGDRVLVKNQSTATQNGIYLCASGAWTRTTDTDTGTELANATVFVEAGTVNGSTQWNCSNSTITIGVTNVTFAQIAGAGTYINGTGLSLTGNVFAIDSTVVTLTGSQVLTNKTLTAPVISQIINTGTITIPTTTGTLALLSDLAGYIPFTLTAATNTLNINGKTFNVTNGAFTKWNVTDNLFYDNSNQESIDLVNRFIKDSSGGLIVNYSSKTNGLGITTATFNAFLKTTNLTANRTFQFPNNAGTFITDGDTGTVTNTMLAGSIAASKLIGTDITTVGTVTTGTLGNGIKILLGSDTTGDSYYNSGSGTLARLAIGASNTVLRGGTTPSYASIATILGYTPMNQGGDTMTGLLILSADPAAALGAATKQYVDNLVTGITWKNAVVAATTANITLSGAQTIDGISVIAGDRVLVKNQSTATGNGIYLCASGAWTRVLDADTGAELALATVLVEAGTVNGGTQWNCSNTTITIGATNVTFVQIAGAGVYTSGTGITLTGNAFGIDATVATLTGAQVLTNKTLTAPIIATISNTGTLTLPTSTDTLVGKATTDTFTNKTFNTAGSGNVFQINGTGITAVTGSGSAVLGTAPTIAGGSITALTAFSLRDTSAAFNVTFSAVSSTPLAAGRTLTIDMVNADHTLKFGGNFTIANNFTTAGNFAITLTATNTTTLTLPTTGTLATLDGSETFTNKTLTAPTINAGAITALTNFAIRDTSAAFDVTISMVSSTPLAAGRILTIDMVNAARTLKFGGNFTIANNFTTAGNFAVTLTATNTTTLTLPTTGTLATLAGSETLSSKTLTAPTINAGTINGLTGFAIRDTSAAFDVTIAMVSSTPLAAGRTLTIDMVNADRTLKIGGNVTLAGSLTTVGAFASTFTMTGTTSVTFPTSGLLLADADMPLQQQVRSFKSTLVHGNTNLIVTSGTAYFVYLGTTKVAMTPKKVRFRVSVGGTGTQTAEIGLFSTPQPPNSAAQTLTKLVATATVDALTGTGVIVGNTADFATSIPAGTHLWAGVRIAMLTTQPDVGITGTVGRDYGFGRILTLAASGVLTGTTFNGVIPADGDNQAPGLEVSLD